ncbi:LysR family transcriptional regulator [Rhodococcus hoagii]|nr:LysR family transcriptional regulator [Prescottella equi]
MDLRSLRYALTLADELHFGRAARAHYIAAQPFGRRIQELESELGARLFERTSRRVSLTDAGERFLPRARRVLAEIDALRQIVDGDHAEPPVLRVGVLGYGLADHWPSTRALLAGYEPGLNLSYVELDWENQYDAVRAGDVDIAVLHDIGGADDLLVEEAMGSERYAVVPVESELADADRLTIADISHLPCVTPIGQPDATEWELRRPLDRDIKVRSPINIPSAVATTGVVGVHAEPARRFNPHPGVRYLPIEGPPIVTAVASRVGDSRRSVAAFRTAVQASTSVDQLSNGFE